MKLKETYGLLIERGSSFALQVAFTDSGTPVDLTSATITAQIRNSANDLLGTFTCTKLNAAQGLINIGLTATQTAAIPAVKTAFYDVKIDFGGGNVKRWLSGTVQVVDTVTQ